MNFAVLSSFTKVLHMDLQAVSEVDMKQVCLHTMPYSQFL
jgi:hypothetical protein